MYGSHRTIRYSLHPTFNTRCDIITNVVTVICVLSHPYQHGTLIEQPIASPNRSYILGIIMYELSRGEQMGIDTDMTTNQTSRLTSSLTNIPLHYYHFIVHTNTIIYNNQQQQQKKKESDKECYYLLLIQP